MSLKSLQTKVQDRYKYTPDIESLKNLECAVVFIYDELKYKCDPVLDGAKHICSALTTTSSYIMKRSYFDDIVCLKSSSDLTSSGYLKGELYLVSPQHIIALDKHYSNGNIFNREVKLVTHEYGDSTLFVTVGSHARTKAFIYFGDDKHWEKQGMTTHRSRLTSNTHPIVSEKKYYDFNSFDFDEMELDKGTIFGTHYRGPRFMH